MITPLDEALAAVRARAPPLPAEDVPLPETYGRVLAVGVRARRDQPDLNAPAAREYLSKRSLKTIRYIIVSGAYSFSMSEKSTLPRCTSSSAMRVGLCRAMSISTRGRAPR